MYLKCRSILSVLVWSNTDQRLKKQVALGKPYLDHSEILLLDVCPRIYNDDHAPKFP